MQIDSTPRACQVYPAGTPKGQGQYHTCYSLGRNICCWVEKEHIFVKIEHVFLERNRRKLQRSPNMLDFDQSKSICLLQAKKPEAGFFLLMIQFGTLF